jgi:hypothetical protein
MFQYGILHSGLFVEEAAIRISASSHTSSPARLPEPSALPAPPGQLVCCPVK